VAITLADTGTRCSLVARVLHWLTALPIRTAIPLGVVANGMADDTSGALTPATGYPVAVFDAAIRPHGAAFVAEGALAPGGATVPVALPFTLAIVEGRATVAGMVMPDRRDFAILSRRLSPSKPRNIPNPVDCPRWLHENTIWPWLASSPWRSRAGAGAAAKAVER
jgi:hypothetical protein